MYVGYGIVTKHELSMVYNSLNNFGCHQIFTDDLDKNSKSQSKFKKALSKLKSNDILVINQIDHLGTNNHSLISNLDLLVHKKVHLRVLEDDILLCWDTSAHITLLQILKKFQHQKNQSQTMARQQTFSQTGKKPGRRPKIDSGKRKLIETLIAANYTVDEICRQVGICRGTFYKYFPVSQNAKSQEA
ncbi:MAG: recombinase family protein [Xenococcaceae cyanobacterium MO_188.B19]|nr:recombinase family protein [Xenococcaceae cyanobacterium MO_188.B19]